MKAVLYTRVSTTGQAEDGISLAAQERKLRAWAELNNAAAVSVFSDAGLSGKRAVNRPNLQEALAAVGKGDALVVFSLSRLSRSLLDTVSIAQALEKRGVDLVSITDRIDTTSASGKLFFHIMAAFNQHYRDTISEHTRNALAHKRANHEKTGGTTPPYGYRLEDGRLVPDAGEQKAVALIRELHATSASLREIAVRLEAEGYRTKTGRTHWQPAAVAAVLKRIERDEKEKAA